MDCLTIEPEIYTPSIDELGNYIDKIPIFNNLQKGVRCSCGSRKDKIYETYSIFSSHIKTKSHQKWLTNLNLNKANYYVENENLKIILQNQKMIIAKMDIEIQNKNITIDYLTQQLNYNVKNNITVNDLLEFD